MSEQKFQKQANIEKLEAQLATATDTRQQIDTMNRLAWAVRQTDPLRTISLSNEVRFLASTGEFTDQPYRRGLALSLRNLGYGYLQLSRYDQALSYLGGALSLFEAVEEDQEQVIVLNILGRTHRHLSDYSAGLDCYLKALKLCQISNVSGAECARSLEGIGQVYALLQEYTQAKNYFLKSLQRYRQLDARSDEAEVLHSLGHLSRDKEDYGEALDYFQQCWRIANESNNKYQAMKAALDIGLVNQAYQKPGEALDYLHQALTLAEEVKAKAQQCECHRKLAEIYKKNRDFEKALVHYEQFHRLKELISNEEAEDKLQNLEMIHRVETAQKEAEIYQLRNVELEQKNDERGR